MEGGRLLIKFTVKDNNPDNIFEEKLITKLVKTNDIDNIIEQVKKRYPDFININSISILTTDRPDLKKLGENFIAQNNWVEEIWSDFNLADLIESFIEYCQKNEC